MFETAELGRTLDKETFRALEPRLRVRLLEAQARIRAAGVPVHVLISGVDGAGKGETVNLLHEWMDPRTIQAVAFGDRSDEEAQRPFFWRYWRTLAPKGRIGVYFGSWYTEAIVGRVQRTMPPLAFERRLRQIEAFERMLVDDGALVVKLWFHLAKKAQKKRLHELLADKRTRWRVSPADLDGLALYDRFARVSADALRATSTGDAPWTLIEGQDARYRSVAVAEHLLDVIDRRLARASSREARATTPAPVTPAARLPTKTAPASPATSSTEPPTTSTSTSTSTRKPKRSTKLGPASLPPAARRTILETLDMGRTIDDDAYEEQLELLQGQLAERWRAARARGQSLTVVLEGWDAAGKGGAIRRLTAALDAREYRTIPIAAPTDEEKAQHYLWRFWRHVPLDGNVTIYDRSWYGRVLVERVEGFCSADAWMRAYDEINAFEEQLVEDDIIVVKLWLHIDADEQLRRFREREQTEFKAFKIGAEDYRNRAKWDDYLQAVHDMVERTSTSWAPWRLVPANDKRLARLLVLEHVCAALEAQESRGSKRRKGSKGSKQSKQSKPKTKKQERQAGRGALAATTSSG
jgi:polyphosphate kinase 2 (PPK2 family)